LKTVENSNHRLFDLGKFFAPQKSDLKPKMMTPLLTPQISGEIMRN
jgi:hypothetical protein